MGKKITHIAKSALALILAVCMMFDSSVTALAAGNDEVVATSEPVPNKITDINNDREISYVAFGDSVTNGYGMTGYRYDDGSNVFGFRREVEGSYPVLMKADLEGQGWKVNLEQLALSGVRMDELHWMLDVDKDYKADYFHIERFQGDWYQRIISRMLNSKDEEAMADAAYIRAKYGKNKTDGDLIKDANAIICAEYKEAVANADLITIDLGTNNFGTFLTNTISGILKGQGINEAYVDFNVYVDANTAKTLDGIVDEMTAQIADPKDTMLYGITRTLARCMMFGYLGYTENYDEALEDLFTINPDAQVIVLDMYSMIRGTELTGNAFKGLDLDQLYNMFIDMANFYSNELSPYAQRVTHASFETDPKLLIDDYEDYVYPDSQGTLVKIPQRDENGNLTGEINNDYNETAVTLLNEFIMEAQDKDVNNPDARTKFQKEVVDNIQMLDSYVYDLQGTIQDMLIDGQIVPVLKESVEPIELAIDAIDLIYLAIDGVALAEKGVDAAIDGVPKAKEAVTTIKEGVNKAAGAVKTAKDGVKTAKDGVKAAREGVALANSLVDMMVDEVLSNTLVKLLFKGSKTSDSTKDTMISTIKNHEEFKKLDIKSLGFKEDNEDNRNLVANEIYNVCCIYYDEINYNGGNEASARKLSVLEIIKFKFVATEGKTDKEATKTAELAYRLNEIYNTNGEEAAILAAMESEITDEVVKLLGVSDKKEAAEFAYGLSKKSDEEAIIAVMETQIDKEILSALGMTDKKEAAKFAYELSKETDENAIIAIIATQIDKDTLEALGAEDETVAAKSVYGIYQVYEKAGGKDNHEVARKETISSLVASKLPDVSGFGLTKEAAADLALEIAANYKALKADDPDEKVAISTILVSVAGKIKPDLKLDSELAGKGYDLYVGVYKEALKDSTVTKEKAKEKTVLTALETELGEDLAPDVYAFYKTHAKDDTAERDRDAEKLAFVSLLTKALSEAKENPIPSEVVQPIATAVFECYWPDPSTGRDNLNGCYKDENVETTVCFFISMAKKDIDAEEAYGAYLNYKNVAEALGKISRLDDIYFDSLLGNVAAGGIDVDAIGDAIMNGTLMLEMPVQGVDIDGKKFEETQTEYDARVEKFKGESSLAIFYFRFMAADGVFTHPSKTGHQTFYSALAPVSNNLVANGVGDEAIKITKDTTMLAIGDAVLDISVDDNFAAQIASKLNMKLDYVQNDYARLEDFYNELVGEDGDAYSNLVGTIDKEFEKKVIENDIILLDVGSMNLGYSAMQLSKYLTDGSTYEMKFSDKENMNGRSLGVTVDGFLQMFQGMLGIIDKDGNRIPAAPSGVGSIMLLLESYGYGITTFTNDFNNLMNEIKGLNPDATIILVGIGDILGDSYFHDEKEGAFFELGHFYAHGAELLNKHMKFYADSTKDVFYIDTMDAQNGALGKCDNIASNLSGALLENALFTEKGHNQIAAKFTCDNLQHFKYSTIEKEATCTDTGLEKFHCVLCNKIYDDVVLDALGHDYDTEAEWVWAENNASATATCTCLTCGEKLVLTDEKIALASADTATCTEPGRVKYEATVEVGDTVYTSTKEVPTTAKGHVFGANPTWTWSEDKDEAVATFACTRKDNEGNAACTHTVSVDAAVSFELTEKTCEKDGQIVYTATVEFKETAISESNGVFTNVINVPIKGGHEYVDGYCKECGTFDPSTRPNPEGECGEKKAAELTSGASLILSLGGTAVGTYTFTETSDGWTIQTADGKYVALVNGALGYSDSAFAWKYSDGRFSADVTTKSSGSSNWLGNILGGILGGIFGKTETTTYYLVASETGLSVSTSATGADAAFATITYTANHKYDDGAVTAPTCTEAGYTTFTCTVCGNAVKMHETKALGHSYAANVVAPTCTEGGYTLHTCGNCGDSYKDNETKATGHDFGADGICTNCGTPEEIQVEVDKEVSLTEGTYELKLGGNSVGTFTFAKSGSGWTIQAADGKYVALDGGELVYSDSAFTWTFSNGKFSATEKSGSSNWLGNILGGILGGIFGSSSKTYYLVADGNELAVSTSSSNANATFFTKEMQTVKPGETPDTPSEPEEPSEPDQPSEPEEPGTGSGSGSGSSSSSWFEKLFGGLFGKLFG